MEKSLMKHLALIMVLCTSLALSLPIVEDRESEVNLRRSRRQISDLRRSNFGRIMGPIIRARDRSSCSIACRAYSTNELASAMNDRVRGPSRRTQYLRSGGFTYARRYYRLYTSSLLNACMGSVCGNLQTTIAPTTATTAAATTAAATTAAATTAAATTAAVTTIAATTAAATTDMPTTGPEPAKK